MMMKKIITTFLIILMIVPNIAMATNNTQDPPTPPPINYGMARLTVSGVTMYEGKPGETINVRFDLNNIGNAEAFNISAVISPAGDGSVYPTVSTSRFVPYIIPGNSTRSINFTLEIDKNTEGGLKTLPVKFEYMSPDGKNGTPGVLNFDIIVKVTKDKTDDGMLTTSNVKFFPSTEILPGQDFILSFDVENIGKAPMSDILVQLDGLKENNVSLVAGLNTQNLIGLSEGERYTFTYFLKADNNAKSGARELKYTLNYNRGKEKLSSTSSLFFTIDRGSNVASNLVIENLEYPKGTMGLNQTATVKFTVRNQGNSPANDITVKAEPTDQSGLVSKTVSTHKLISLLPGEIAQFEYQFFTTEGTATKNYPINISVTSIDDPNNPETKAEVTQFIGIFVKGKDDKDTPKSTPKLIIDKYSFEPQLVKAGSNFTMKLSFYNTNSAKSVKNIKIFLTSEPGSANNSQESNTSVFTPVDSSNTFYIDSIKPGGRVEKEITMYTIPNAIAKTHIITANFEYEDAEANPYTAKELIGVPVIQESKLGIGELVIPDTAFVGEEVNIQTQFYNTGKVTLFNLMVKLEGDFKSPHGQYYVGNFNSGSTDRFDGYIIPEKAGTLKGKLVFSYEDSAGEINNIEKPFEINVEDGGFHDEEMQFDEMGNPIILGPDGMPIPQEPMKKPMNPALIVGGIVGAIVVFFGVKFIIKKKKAKKEKDLTIDE